MADIISRGSVEMTILDLTDTQRVLSFISSNVSRYVVYNPDTNNYNPNYNTTKPILTPYLQADNSTTNLIGQATSVKWSYQNNSMGQLNLINDTNPDFTINPMDYSLTINKNVLALNQSIKFYIEIQYDIGNESFISLSNIELLRINNGISGNDPIIAVLDNDTDSIHTDTEGNGGDYSYLTSSLTIFDGAIDVTANWNITITPSDGIIGVQTGSSYKVNSMSTDSGKVTFIATRDQEQVEKVYHLNKIKSGKDGELERVYSDLAVIKKDQNDNYIPTNIIFKAQRKVANRPWDNLLAGFKVYTSLGDNNYTLKYTSTKLEYSYNYIIEENISMIKVEIYSSLAYTTLIDTEYIPIIVDGKENIISIIQTPEGIISKNGQSTLKAKMNLYKANESILANHYQWYKLDPQSSGDTNSGVGWRVLSLADPQHITGFNSSTIIIPPLAIDGSETFMCIANYENRLFRSTITVSDINDPYMVSVLGNEIFKNGSGTNSYTCKVYQNGIEKDLNYVTKPLYTYKWNLYDSNNVLVGSFNKTGKEIIIDASEFSNKAILTCTVDEI